MDPLKKAQQEHNQDETIFADIDLESKSREHHIFNARLLLFLIAGFQIYTLFANLSFFTGYRLVWHIFLICFFTAMAFWAKHNSLAALLSALILWLGIYIVAGIMEPGTFAEGLILNFVVVALLGQGIFNAWKTRRPGKS